MSALTRPARSAIAFARTPGLSPGGFFVAGSGSRRERLTAGGAHGGRGSRREGLTAGGAHGVT
jgi:hypothetical protein